MASSNTQSAFKSMSNEALLDALEEERKLFQERSAYGGDPNKNLFLELIAELQDREVYPKETVPGNPNTVEAMVSGYGAHWFVWKGKSNCPHCGCDLHDHETGPPFKREIGIIENDRCVGFQCPKCKDWI